MGINNSLVIFKTFMLNEIVILVFGRLALSRREPFLIIGASIDFIFSQDEERRHCATFPKSEQRVGPEAGAPSHTADGGTPSETQRAPVAHFASTVARPWR